MSICVGEVFKPLLALRGADGALPPEERAGWAAQVAGGVTAHYLSLATATLDKVAAEDAALRKILDRLSAIEEQLLRVTPASRETAVTPSDIARTPRATSRGSAHFREKTARHRRHLR